MIPHQHLEDINIVNEIPTFETAESILDFIQVIFLTDLGEGHLDHMDVEQTDMHDVDIQISFSMGFAARSLNGITPVSTELFNAAIDHLPMHPPEQYFTALHRRGPPSYL